MIAPLRRLFLFAFAAVLAAAAAGAATPRDRSFDWTRRGVALNVVDQGESNTCWAVASAQALEASWAIRNRQRVVLSPQPIIHRTRQSDGTPIRVDLNQLKDKGTARAAVYPYTLRVGPVRKVATPYRAASWGWVAPGGKKPTNDQLKRALIKHGPLVVNLYSKAPA